MVMLCETYHLNTKNMNKQYATKIFGKKYAVGTQNHGVFNTVCTRQVT